MNQTIYALSSGPGLAGIAVIRISGSTSAAVLKKLSGQDLPPARRATRVRLTDPLTGELLDHGLALWFPRPSSFTGEDVAEFHIHGGRAVIDAVLSVLGRLDGMRLAMPGEFTRRAFDNGKLDLTEAEGLADLINAETAMQRHQALRQMEGALGRVYSDWRIRLLRTLAYLEADLEFPDEDLPADASSRVVPEITIIGAQINDHLADLHRGERLRDGLVIAILGAPNVGKSSLLNYLARRDAAIVSVTAGTTRDVIEVRMDLGGYPVIVADTAGLRESGDQIEVEGVRRAEKLAREAGLKLILFDATSWPGADAATARLVDDDSLIVVSKCDMAQPDKDSRLEGRPIFPTSSITGQGMEALVKALTEATTTRLAVKEGPSLTRARHREALEECLACLQRAETASALELATEDVRMAVRALGRIVGRVDVEEVLDLVFRDFCIGK